MVVASHPNPSTNRRRLLRALGKLALEQRGYNVEVKRSLGVAPGAQLVGTKDSETRRFAVRACLNRRVQGVRHENGSWKTLPDVDEVVVVAPSRGNPAVVEVFGFEPEIVVHALDSALADQRDRDLNPKPEDPVFVSLDKRHPRRGAHVIPGLKRKAKWSRVLPTALVDSPRPRSEHKIGLLEHLRREAAAWTNDDTSDIVVDIHFTKREPAGATQLAEQARSVGDGGRAHETETMTEAEHEILDQYLTIILRNFREGKVDEKNAVLDIADAFTTLQNEGLGSVLTYLRATLGGEYDN
jgi:hypothetical protein